MDMSRTSSASGTEPPRRLGLGRPAVKRRLAPELPPDVRYRKDAVAAARLDEDPLVGGGQGGEKPATVRRPCEPGEPARPGEERSHVTARDEEDAVAAHECEPAVGRERERADAADAHDVGSSGREVEEDDLVPRRE